MPSTCVPRVRYLLMTQGGRAVVTIVQGNRVTMVEKPPDPCLDAASIDSLTPGGSSARTLSEALAGRIAGVSVLRSSGVIGSGSRVRIRGGSWLLGPRELILIIDVVRDDGSQPSLGPDIGGQRPPRLDDIPLHDIELVTVLRGPASSALYGANGAGG